MTQNEFIFCKDNERNTCTKSQYISQGANGAVYQCESNEPNEKYVIKISSKPLKQEIAFSSISSSSECIVPIYKVLHRTDEIDYKAIVMKKMDGNLLDYIALDYNSLQNGTVLVQVVNNLVTMINCFHKLSYSHNDIKPANIGFIKDKDSYVLKLFDFGSAVGNNENTIANSIEHTILYHPICDNNDTHDFRVIADKWAMGCVIYEIIVILFNNIKDCFDQYLFSYSSTNGVHFSSCIYNLKMKPNDLDYILSLTETQENQDNHNYTLFLDKKRSLFKKFLDSNYVKDSKSLIQECIKSFMAPIFTHRAKNNHYSSFTNNSTTNTNAVNRNQIQIQICKRINKSNTTDHCKPVKKGRFRVYSCEGGSSKQLIKNIKNDVDNRGLQNLTLPKNKTKIFESNMRINHKDIKTLKYKLITQKKYSKSVY